MVLGKLVSYMQKNKIGPLFTPYKKVNWKWIKDLNVSPETLKILQENTGSNYSDIGCRNIFLDMSPKARETKAKINYWDYIKIKNYFTVNETTTTNSNNKKEHQPTEWEKIFTNGLSN